MSPTNRYRELLIIRAGQRIEWPGNYWLFTRRTIRCLSADVWMVREHADSRENELGEVAP